ncbi:class I SAM-dependent methyltransferase [Nocardia sp. N2S4-5]|uniref:class I SAM-dependent methyltransferase n=1 Tax=Nocardia sp. N2S4-5 TaxID=3351565 RepID=UPI0037CF0BA5
MGHETGTHTLDFDAELERHNEILRRAAAVATHDHVLDIGCGTGQTTRQAARAARSGTALGVDVSAQALDRARELARSAGLGNITFEHADAESHRFPQARFDLAISRFGTMFFADPAGAFVNIGRALRPHGRLVMLVWQAHDRNEWDVTIRRALESAAGPIPDHSAGPDAFALADPQTIRDILHTAEFIDIAITDIDEKVYYGPDVTTALSWVRGFTYTSEFLKRLNPEAATRALENLRAALAAHHTDHGVHFDSRAWLVTARRPAK